MIGGRAAGSARLVGVLMVCWLWPLAAAADAVDDAWSRGNHAAAQDDWEAAAKAYDEAALLLPQMNSTLAYNQGTANAHAGDLGRATYHLRRALDTRGGPTAQVVELARANLAEVRRRAELAATVGNKQIDRPANWWDLLLDALRATWVGWFSLVAGGALLVVWSLERRRPRARGAWQAAVLVLALAYLTPGLLHGLALRADSIAPAAIVLGDRVDARARPGAHADSTLVIQGGARVRIVDRSPGWRQVRLPGGLTGWVPEGTLGELSSVRPLAAGSGSPQVAPNKPDPT
jgi:hypothetical protein